MSRGIYKRKSFSKIHRDNIKKCHWSHNKSGAELESIKTKIIEANTGNRSPTKRQEYRKWVSKNNPMKRSKVVQKVIQTNRKIGTYKIAEKNMRILGRSNKGKTLSKEHKRKIGENTINRYLSGDFNYKGYFYSKKNNIKIGYRSKDELECMKVFDKLTKLKKWEYEKDKIAYIDKKEKLRYTIPDFHLYWNDGSEEIIEYKPEWKLKGDFDNTKLKLEAMRRYAKEKNYKFKVLSENNIVENGKMK